MKISDVIKRQEALKNKEVKTSVSETPAAKGTAAPQKNGKKVIKVLRTRETPNPNALQYVLNAVILDHGKKPFSSKSECEGDAMAEALFNIPGVNNVFVMDNFVTVTKDEDIDWNPCSDQVWKAIDNHVTLYQAEEKDKPSEVDTTDFLALSQEEKLKAIENVLNRSIRSNLARDGGGVELKGLEGSVVKIHYEGACGSCPTSSTGTLKYIEGLFKQQLHRDLTVVSD